jgi:hypothetical protein
MPEVALHDLARLDKFVPGQARKPRPTVYTRSPQETEHDLQLVYFIVPLERRLLDEQLEENAPASNTIVHKRSPLAVREKRGLPSAPQVYFGSVHRRAQKQLRRAIPKRDNPIGEIRLASLLVEPGKPKIRQLERAIRVDEDVRSFEVAVDHTLVVEVG